MSGTEDARVGTLSAAEVEALLPALANEIETWQDADCGEHQAENDAWVTRLLALRDRLS